MSKISWPATFWSQAGLPQRKKARSKPKAPKSKYKIPASKYPGVVAAEEK